MKKHTFFTLCLCGILSNVTIESVNAQVTPLQAPYMLGFEASEQTEINNWCINPGPDAALCKDQWMIGTATRNGGLQSLYISCNGQEPQFGATPNVQYVYRDFTINAGNYECTFDYRCMGVKGSALYAGVSFQSSLAKDMVAKNGSSSLPSSIATASLLKDLRGSSRWKNASFKFNARDNVTYRIFFAWVSGNTDTTLAMPIGACLDNIQITTTNCAKPKSLQAESRNDSVFVTWQGTSEQYIFERRKHGTDKWYKYSGLTEKSLIIEGLNEGAYDFRVRGVCNDIDTSAYTYLNSFIVYYTENHCIDFIHLDNENIHGTIGQFANPYAIEDTIVDFGPEDKYSRHTVNTEPDIYDPRTNNRLVTIPDGELASVRLGNWNVNAQAESMSFDFIADSANNAILLIKYAIVMEDPDHTASSQPRFTMEILDEYGDVIDPTCGAADFTADATREGWHTVGTGSDKVTWKDWTTLGLNLLDLGLAGEKITIRFTTYDCSASGHYGYAYFTLGCIAAKIYGTSCGDDPIMTVQAPVGFSYSWYNKNEELVSTTQALSVLPSDTTTYRCHLSYVESPSCGFDLYSASKPRFPVAEFSYKWAPTDCQNKVRFYSKSHIMVKFDDYVKHNYDEKCDELQWDFGNGNLSPDENPVFTFPNEGGDFPITLWASIAEGRCQDDTTIIIHVPAIGDTENTKDTTICEGSYVYWGDTKSDNVYYAAEEKSYTVTWKSISGCDSTWILNLKINPVHTQQMTDTTICAEVPLVIDGQVYKLNTSGKFYRFYKNQYGCDSTVWMNVNMLDSIAPTFQIREMTETQSGAIFINGKGWKNYTIDDNSTKYTIDSIVGLTGGVFTLTFYNELDCSYETEVRVGACLPNYIYQRWDGVLSLKKEDVVPKVIGDFGFTDFQWYKDNEPIAGANLSYLYIERGLDTNAKYVLKMKRMSNGEEVETCPFKPSSYTQEGTVYVYPTTLRNGEDLTIQSSYDGYVDIYSYNGIRVASKNITTGINTIPLKVNTGIYTVIVTGDNNESIKKFRVTVIY